MAGDDMLADELALALARGMKVVDAGKLVGLSERSVYRRLAEPQFRQVIQTIRQRMLDGAVGQLVEASGQAVRHLVDLMESDTVPAAQRLAACRAVLEFSTKLREQVEFEERLSSLEERFNGTSSPAIEAA